MHPLIGNLDHLKDTEIENKINELTTRYFQTRNPGVQSQITAILDTYKEEIGRRRHAEYQKMMNNRDKNLDKLIKVN
jgi:hypothetical protein